MKKFLMITLMIAVGVSFAFASSIKVPWFVDSALPGTGNPPSSKVLGLVYLASNDEGPDPLVAEIKYFNAEGIEVGYDTGRFDSNTFTIDPLATVAFRPVQYDVGGQESEAGASIPDRNTADGSFNGSCVIRWVGGPGLIQGSVIYIKTKPTNGEQTVVSYAHLLPAGVGTGE